MYMYVIVKLISAWYNINIHLSAYTKDAIVKLISERYDINLHLSAFFHTSIFFTMYLIY